MLRCIRGRRFLPVWQGSDFGGSLSTTDTVTCAAPNSSVPVCSQCSCTTFRVPMSAPALRRCLVASNARSVAASALAQRWEPLHRRFSKGEFPEPPPDWYQRGTWIDASEIEKRMVDDNVSDAPSQATAPAKEPETDITKQIKAIIRYRGGPITVAEYMKEVLTNPLGGFYAAHGGEAIGPAGHFITSPEILPLFGEMLGAWAFITYEEMGRPERFSLVELGPGKGTLLAQMLRAIKDLDPSGQFLAAVELHLVEVSPDLRQAQFDALDCSESMTFEQANAHSRAVPSHSNPEACAPGQNAPVADPDHKPVQRRPELRKKVPRGTIITKQQLSRPPVQASNYSDDLARVGSGISRLDFALARTASAIVKAHSGLAHAAVEWHYTLDEVPDTCPSIIVGHEYLDALPIHQFVNDQERGWLEVLVNESQDASDPRV